MSSLNGPDGHPVGRPSSINVEEEESQGLLGDENNVKVGNNQILVVAKTENGNKKKKGEEEEGEEEEIVSRMSGKGMLMRVGEQRGEGRQQRHDK